MSYIECPPGQAGKPSWSEPAPAQAGRIGVLLVNLGTPDGTGYWAIRRYLSEFLSDRRVIEASPLWWQPLLQGVILSRRPFRTGAAYREIWNREKDESPLRSFTRAQAENLRALWPEESTGVVVDWAMRYGQPSVAERLQGLVDQGCGRVLLVPLYPQYSATTTATVNDAAFRALMRMRRQPAIRTLPSFPDHPAYIRAMAERIRASLQQLGWEPELLIGSFHGLPRRYVEAGDPYMRECKRTMVALRQELGLDAERFPMTFQSRFGREPWLEPYTDDYVASLPARGIRRIAVVAPGFLSDCVETLEELGSELREEFLGVGGTRFHLLPCLNDSAGATSFLATLVQEELAGWSSPHG
ncbi:ferrochelatase [Pseudoroseomonas ludipueritiae]|uniref:Ferrochelatase n=1 Tax=Pseudoroseomonas ludipueritiae TaxID=198093 RepID=A0ABR7R244_9PROT|nr:ferrochelatase [Pseudoroseomonas ludipueritiae]MBC9175809.1 ferrochelatase [Pseudoroseomonas ludipueritiae]